MALRTTVALWHMERNSRLSPSCQPLPSLAGSSHALFPLVLHATDTPASTRAVHIPNSHSPDEDPAQTGTQELLETGMVI